MKQKIVYFFLSVIVLGILTFPVIKFLFHDEKKASVRRAANCQFLRVRNHLLSDSNFWSGSYEGDWAENIDLKKTSCGRKLELIESKLFDVTGAQIVLKVSSVGVSYLARIKGPNKDFFSLAPADDEFEFKEEYNSFSAE